MNRFEQLPEADQIDRYTRLAQKVLDGYGLAGAEIVWQPGTRDAVFRVSKSDERGTRTYALRIGDPARPVDQLNREIAWLTALCRVTDLVAPEPVLARDGELIRRVGISGVPGFRPCVLLRWVDGQPIDGDPEAVRVRRTGEFVARLHAYGATYRWPDEITAPRRSAARIAESISRPALARHADTVAVDGFFVAIERVQRALGALGDGADVAGIIHGDLRLRRIRFRADRIGAVGFDRCRWGYFATDIATLSADLGRCAEAEALREALFDGYRSVRPVSEETIAQLPTFDALRAIDKVVGILAQEHHPLEADLATALERPLAQLTLFADA